MKLHIIRSVLVACCFLAATVVMAADAVSVGDFVVRLADTLNPASTEIDSLDEAKVFFANRGVVIPSSLNLAAPLTEMDVAVVSSLLGIEVTARNPEKAFDAESVDGFVGFLREEIDYGRISPTPSDDGSPNGPPLTISGLGACCPASGPCFQDQPSDCVAEGGVYKGKGIPCSPDPCVPGKGVCCEPDPGGANNKRVCTFTFPGDCSGVFRGLQSCTKGTCQGNKGREPATPMEP
jgi:hypothetical protein